MRRKSKNIIVGSIFIFALCTALFACRKTEEYPSVPVISFKSFATAGHVQWGGATIDSAVVITISYTDGDGNIGFLPGDTMSKTNPYYYNFIVKFYKKSFGTFYELPPKADAPYSARIPNITPEGNHKSIKGDISLGIILAAIPVDKNSNYDTVRCEVFIYDRAHHKSNTITTSDLAVRVQ